MKTMVQPPEVSPQTQYDIDTGVAFKSQDSASPRTTRNWVRDALNQDTQGFKKEATSKKNCVRVEYSDGKQCDFPVFKIELSNGGERTYYLSSGEEWVASDPKSMTEWFEDTSLTKSPKDDESQQLRRIVRLFKQYCKTHQKLKVSKFPSGLLSTALAVECYEAAPGRDDLSFKKLLDRLSVRPAELPVIADGKNVCRSKDFEKISRVIDKAKQSVIDLNPLDDMENSNDKLAADCWNMVFRHSFFEKISAANKEIQQRKSSGSISRPWLPSQS